MLTGEAKVVIPLQSTITMLGKSKLAVSKSFKPSDACYSNSALAQNLTSNEGHQNKGVRDVANLVVITSVPTADCLTSRS